MKKFIAIFLLVIYLGLTPKPVAAAFDPVSFINTGIAALFELFSKLGKSSVGNKQPESQPSATLNNSSIPSTESQKSDNTSFNLPNGGPSKLSLLENIKPGSGSQITNISSLLTRIKGISGNSQGLVELLNSNSLGTSGTGGVIDSLKGKIGVAEGLIGKLRGGGSIGSSIGDLEALKQNLLGQKLDLQQISQGLQSSIQPNQPGSPASTLSGFSWIKKENLPTPRNEVSTAVVNGKIYIMGGNIQGGITSNKVEIYDPTTGSWSNGPDMPDGRNHAKAVAVGSTIYVMGGFTGNFLSYQYHADVFALDTQSGQWTSKTSMPTIRGAFGADAVNGKIYAAGGTGPDGMTNVLEIYDPASDSWSTGKSMTTVREHLTATTFNGKLYTFGGRKALISKIFTNLNTVEIYDPGSDSWTTAPSMPTARSGTASALFNNMIVVVGGEELTSIHNEAEAFNPTANTWHTLPNLPTGRHGIGAATVNNNLYVIGGGDTPGLMMGVSGANESLVPN